MSKVTIKQSKKQKVIKLAKLYEVFKENNDYERVEKTKNLLLKIEKDQYIIAFCGHFSAGKSTMINKITETNLLPSSPIPTSANLVTLKQGTDYLKIFYYNEKPNLIKDETQLKNLKFYCQDGNNIKSIVVSHSEIKVPKGTVIIDTPGIDSTDDAHRLATESALYLADEIYYVMDYNNVQSEVNFSFVKKLSSLGKRVSLIVNQIDKHRDEELSFFIFKENIRSSFKQWGIKRVNIFFTTLKNTDVDHNQFIQLKNYICESDDNRKFLLDKSYQTIKKQLIDEHIQFLRKEAETNLEEKILLLKTLSNSERENLTSKYKKLNLRRDELDKYVNGVVNKFKKTTDKIISNSYLMPYETRASVKSYLAALEPSFKVGLFFTKKKTLIERENRLQILFKNVRKTISSELEWHLREVALETLKRQQINNAKLLQAAQTIKINFQKDLLAQLVKDGALLSGQYVINYTEELSTNIRALAKRVINEIQKKISKELESKVNQKKVAINAELAKLTEYLEAEKLSQNAFRKITSVEKVLTSITKNDWSNEAEYKDARLLINNLKLEANNFIIKPSQNILNFKSVENNKRKLHDNKLILNEVNKKNVNQRGVKETISRLITTAKQLNKITGFQHFTKALEERAQRLSNQSYTIALFGAFSAGKSSFANALIGEKILPVSPNPTTATINKIMAPINGRPHGSALVKFKKYDDLLKDVNSSLTLFNETASTLSEAHAIIESILQNNKYINDFNKTQVSFLQAFCEGYNTFKHQLGDELLVNSEQFKLFVANEDKSCFVELIEVYVECGLTKEGITIVDTPGADSINTRHTEVAFDYIKNSDACFYVMYYNHAFSKGDREFLIQLGRVKDSFEVDKMFFIINAIDLASSEEELDSVVHYVKEQLLMYGIRQPKLSPVSSLHGLREKISKVNTNTSRLKQFEQKFGNFLNNEITDVAIVGAENELHNVTKRLEQLIEEANQTNLNKTATRNKLVKEKETAFKYLTTINNQITWRNIEQEIDELVFYIKQRVFLRFNDFFREEINPTVIKGRNARNNLTIAFNEFIRAIGFEFAQEMRATTLRIERFLKAQLKLQEELILNKLSFINERYIFTKTHIDLTGKLHFQNAFENYNNEDFKQSFTYFKNPKMFFENNGRQLMGEDVKKRLSEIADQYLANENKRLKVYYKELLERELLNMINSFENQLGQFYESLFAIYEYEHHVDELKNVYSIITKEKNT